MLRALSIRNFAIIEQLELTFADGVTVFTGETGAGKSILMDALAILVGKRASTEYIRTGTEEFFLSAVFDISAADHKLHEFLVDQNLPLQDGEIIISRRLDQQGRGRILVNGMAVPLRTLLALGDLLVDIHGQYDNYFLLKPEYHLEVLDNSDPEIAKRLAAYQAAYREWKSAVDELASMQHEESQREQRKDFLRHQIHEIREAKLDPAEEDELSEKIIVAENTEKILQSVYAALQCLREDAGIQEKLYAGTEELQKAERFSPSLATPREKLEQMKYLAEDITAELQAYVYEIDFSPEDLAAWQQRQQEIRALQKKYGATIGDILEYCQKAELELEELLAKEENQGDLEMRCRIQKEQAEKLRETLNEQREKQALLLADELSKALHDLDMPDNHISWLLIPGDTLTANGLAAGELLFSANRGEALKPLREVASGGELARIALALKTLAARKMLTPTIVLDEVDVGISGDAAIAAGQRIALLGREVQVLCITHSAATAAAGDQHYHLYKEVENERTQTHVRILSQEEHVQALAHIIAGNEADQSALETAEQLVARVGHASML